MRSSLEAEQCVSGEEEGKSLKVAVLTSDDVTVSESANDGEATTEFLFRFGAVCLERYQFKFKTKSKQTFELFLIGQCCCRSGLDWANSMVHVLQVLLASTTWRHLLESHLSRCVERLGTCEQPHLSELLSLFVVTGFPEVSSTLVWY